jgi:hypothetical protein
VQYALQVFGVDAYARCLGYRCPGKSAKQAEKKDNSFHIIKQLI